jgi:hypothetical protein
LSEGFRADDLPQQPSKLKNIVSNIGVRQKAKEMDSHVTQGQELVKSSLGKVWLAHLFQKQCVKNVNLAREVCL